jgi:acyl-coenzyme A synthetase/AMP-(fatty) acid ligase
VDDVLLPIWERVRPLLRTLVREIVVPFGGGVISGDRENYKDFIDVDASGYEYPDQDENEPVGMCYTSGTTVGRKVSSIPTGQ